MKVVITFKSKKWYREPSASLCVENIKHLDDIDEAIAQLSAIKYSGIMMKHFDELAIENIPS